jgi:fructokinase
MNGASPLFGCIEAGGTKFVVGIATAPDDVRETSIIPTTTPHETIVAAVTWLKAATQRHGILSSVGIASFGPAELDRASPNWGYITETTKPGWSNTKFASRVANEFGVKVGFDTDVNGAARAEALWGAGIGHRISVYLTIGTGIGGGAIVDGTPLHGLSHPEMGHIRPCRHVDDFDFPGVCPFHGDCLEGLASGPAILARWGASLSDLPSDHPAHEIIAGYLAQLVTTLQSIMEPGCIILGGGVMSTPGLLENVRKQAAEQGASYFRGKPEDVIVSPGLGDRAGLLGGLALAMDAFASA